MDPGIYTLVLLLDRAQEIEVGSLGIVKFVEGYYSYTGSARGPGGLKRVERHKRVLLGSSSVRRWHIDYLLPYTSLVEVVVTRASADLECRIARRIGSELKVVPHFGSTDCRCPGHLHFSIRLDQIQDVVRRSHQYYETKIGEDPVTKSWRIERPGSSPLI
jgi:Uri superfamily endonuclease